MGLNQGMPGIDQILSIVSQQGADELRLAADEEPQVFAAGVRKRFVMAATPEPVLRQLLGDLLSPERDRQLQSKGRLEFAYEATGIGRFNVVLALRQNRSIEVTFATSAKMRPADDTPPAPDVKTSASRQSVSDRTASGAVQADPRGDCEPTVGPARSAERREIRAAAALDDLVVRAVNARASDIHVADGEPAYLRVDGQLKRTSDSLALRVESLFVIGDSLRQRIYDGTALEFSLDWQSQQRLRISLYRASAGLAAAIRLLPTQAPTLKSLNLPVSLETLAQVTQGLVLVCGATGSGKSSTLAALARHALESRSIGLITLEDPIEFQLSSSSRSIARQRQVGRDVANFAGGLREALRGDPDVILVGELRDAETIRLALTAAETGHLVLASLHSGSAASCVERIIDAYPNEARSQIRVQLADGLRAVVVQKLLPSARGQGRVPVLEVMRVTHAVANVIREGKTAQLGSLIQAGARDGMLSLERCLADCVKAATLSPNAARDAANDPDSLMMYLAK